MIEVPCSEDASVHRAQHLHVPEWIKPESAGDALGDDLHQLDDTVVSFNGVEVAGLAPPRFDTSGICPLLMRCALTTMRLSAACLKTSVRRATGTRPELLMSASTCPGPRQVTHILADAAFLLWRSSLNSADVH
jgi:hypothetical protein